MNLHIKEFVATHVTEAGGNVRRGQRAAAEDLKKYLSGPKPALDAREISTRALFEAMVVPDGRAVEEFVWSDDFHEAMDASQFPIAVKYITDSVAMPAYDRGLADAMFLVRDRGVSPKAGGEDVIKVKGFLNDLYPDRVYTGMPYNEGSIKEKYAEIEIATFGKIIGFTKYALLADDGSLLNDAEMMAEEVGVHQHTFIVQSAADLAVDATGRAAGTGWWYEGTKRAVYSADHSASEEGSQTNLNTRAALSLETAPTTSLKTIRKDQAVMKDIYGRPVFVRANVLLVPGALGTDAQIVTQSPFQSENANNGITPRWFASLRIIETPILDAASTVDYYLGQFDKAHWWYWGWKFKTDRQGSGSDADFERDGVLRQKVSYRGGCGYVDYRWVYKADNT